MPALPKAYGCAEIRTGVGLIGWLGTVVSSIILFYFCNNLLGGFVIETTISPQLYQLKADYTIWEAAIILLKWFYYFCASFLLIVAALKKRETMLLPWLVMGSIDIIVLAYNVLYMGFANGPFKVFITHLVLLFSLIYNWLIVYSYYQERQNAKSRNYTYISRKH